MECGRGEQHVNVLLSDCDEVAIDFYALLMSVKKNSLLEGSIYICLFLTSITIVEVLFKFGFQSIN